MITVGEFADEYQRLAGLLAEAHNDLETQVFRFAQLEADYRKARATAWQMCPSDQPGERDWTAARREAWVDAETSDDRRDRDVAEGLRKAGIELVRSLRGQISALQTLVNAYQEESKYARADTY